MKIKLVLLITLCLLSGNMEIVSGMKMGGNALENIAAAAAEHQVANIAKNRNEETVETKMGCGCKLVDLHHYIRNVLLGPGG